MNSSFSNYQNNVHQFNCEQKAIEDSHQYQNVTEFQSNQDYQVPTAKLKRTQFSQHNSKSFPVQGNQSKSLHNNCLRKGFQPNLALHKINKVNSHPLATKEEESNNSFTLNRTIESKNSFKHLPRYCRTQSTTSSISLQSVMSNNFVKDLNSVNNNETNKFNRTNSKNLSSYSNTPPLPIANSTLTKTLRKNTTQSSINYSMQSFKSNYLAPFSPEIELNGIESVTSSSYLHGFILISIILLSIIAFVLSKLQDACEDFFFSTVNHGTCYQTSQLFFSSMLLCTSLFAFIVYFLHLIGQCDYLNLMAKRKVFTEILITCLVIFCLLLSSLTLILTTVAIFNWINTVSLIIAFIVCILFKVRIYLLFREYRMLNDKPINFETEMNDNLNQTNQLNQQLAHSELDSTQFNQQKRFSMQSKQSQFKNDELDDDVFN